MQRNLFKQATVWSKEDCQYCDMVKHLLASHDYEMEIKDIEREFDLFKKTLPNARTVPQVIIEGKIIGGYSDVVKYLSR